MSETWQRSRQGVALRIAMFSFERAKQFRRDVEKPDALNDSLTCENKLDGKPYRTGATGTAHNTTGAR